MKTVYNPPMGQFALGIRSLLIRAAIFVVMASLLAWALGGTLFPKPVTLAWRGVEFAGDDWHWQATAGHRIRNHLVWQIIRNGRAIDDRTWTEIAGPIVIGDSLFYAGLRSRDEGELWQLERVGQDGRIAAAHTMPDRLAVEQQLARLEAGLSVQDMQTILRERRMVLDPGAELADGLGQ